MLFLMAADPELQSAGEQLDSEANQVVPLPSLPLLLLRASVWSIHKFEPEHALPALYK